MTSNDSMNLRHILRKVHRRWKAWRVDPDTAGFIEHNRRVWTNSIRSSDGGEVLLEVNDLYSAVISYSYFANVLAEKHDAVISGFVPRQASLWDRLLKPAIHGVYRSFGTREIFYLGLTTEQERECDDLCEVARSGLKTKRDVERLAVEGVWIGDLVYDSYLKRCMVPSIDITSEEFRLSLKDSVGTYLFWRDYFQSHDVRAINVSHCGYDLAIVLRVAVKNDVPAYQVNATHAYRLSGSDLWAYCESHHFRQEFQKLPLEVQRRGLVEAKERLDRRFSGEVAVDMHYSSRSAFESRSIEPVLNPSNRLKVFVALHCFFDNPHPYGVGLFPDFYEWLAFLGGVSEKTEYDWYLKTHPDFLPGNHEVLEEFLRAYPKFALLPSETSHHQIIQDGIDVVLTVHGTVGFEYAALGVPVINASLRNPHVAYGFNVHPATVKEYESALMNLPKVRLAINREEVYEYYFMRFVHTSEDLVFDNYSKMRREFGYAHETKSSIFSLFLKQLNNEKHRQIKGSLGRFVESEEYWLQRKHMVGCGQLLHQKRP
jgi:hypothetical protein